MEKELLAHPFFLADLHRAIYEVTSNLGKVTFLSANFSPFLFSSFFSFFFSPFFSSFFSFFFLIIFLIPLLTIYLHLNKSYRERNVSRTLR
jgi:hypothetical protein